MQTVPLTKNLYALVDDVDHASVSTHGWFAVGPDATGVNYRAGRRIITVTGKRTTRYLHREIFETMINGKIPAGFEIDHIDHNPLNNTRANLRLVTHQTNTFNCSKHKLSQAGMKFVNETRNGRFQARITINGVGKYLGTFDTAEEAHQVGWAKAQEVRGAYACKG